ncbi:hypothetical protein [Pseudarthrobacter sp. N5]|uniref:hypothetical protein n=1 Tax=Pseudarthrobacter sp. N5 TaxID=3418416 RepID=UPI003CF0345F
MESFEAEALIHAGGPTVWNIINYAGNYPVWESGITGIRGEVRNGGTIRISTRTGGMYPGLARSVRTFTVSARPGGHDASAREEEFSGPPPGLLGKTPTGMAPALTDYVNAVKKRAESVG